MLPEFALSSDSLLSFPTSAWFSRLPAYLATTTTLTPGRGLFVWANRCQATDSNDCGRDGFFNNNEGNPIGYIGATSTNIRYTVFFSSYNKANLCTIWQAKTALGFRNREVIESILGNAGLAVAYNSQDLHRKSLELDTLAEKRAYVGSQARLDEFLRKPRNRTERWIKDTCFINEDFWDFNADLAIDKVMLDYEVTDARTTQLTENFLRRFVNEIKSVNPNVKVGIFAGVNFIGDRKIEHSALEMRDVHDIFDYMSIWIVPGKFCNFRKESIQDRLERNMKAILGSNWENHAARKKIFIMYSLGDKENLAYEINRFVKIHDLAGFLIHRNNAKSRNCDISSPMNPIRQISDLLGIQPSV